MVSSVAIRLLHQKFNKIIYKIVKKYPMFARRSISSYAELPIIADSDDVVLDKHHDNPGRTKKFTERDKRSLVRDYINKNDYFFRQIGRKGQVPVKDIKENKSFMLRKSLC